MAAVSDSLLSADRAAPQSGRARPGRAWLKSIYGLTAPYDFTRAIPLLVSIVLLLAIAGAFAEIAYTGKVHWGTSRCAYFVYIGLLALAGAALSFAPRLAWPLIALSFLDFSLGGSAFALANYWGLSGAILPRDHTKQEFVYHPLLQTVPSPNFSQLTRRLKIVHDSYGLRGVERDKNLLARQTVIAAVGGSTTYDIAVGQGQTWPEMLERDLGSGYAVLNHGVPAYSSVEHVIQTLFYLDAYGITPRCAIYYVGWNDIRQAHMPQLDSAYANYLLEKVNLLQARKKPVLAEISPLAAIAVAYLQLWLDTVPQPQDISGLPPGQGSDTRLEKIYRRNLEAIAAINAKRGITSLFVGQILNRSRLGLSTRTSHWPLTWDKDVWPLQERFNDILKDTADASGSPAFIPPIDQFQDSDFVDEGHFSAAGSKKFATLLTPFVRRSCTANFE